MATGPASALGMLLRRTSPRTRALAIGAGASSLAAKVVLVLAARGVAVSDVKTVAALGVGAAVAFAVQRILTAEARVAAECDLVRSTAGAVLGGDVLSVPKVSPLHTLLDGGYQALQLVSQTLPQVAANGLAALVVLPIVAHELPSRVLAIAAVALVVVLAVALAVRRSLASLQERVAAAQARVRERTTVALDGRLELVAGGREAGVLADLEREIARYHRDVRSASIASAFVGRAPLGAGAFTVGVAVLVDGATRDALGAALLGNTLLLASALPIVLGALLGAGELVRAAPHVRPLADLLETPPRDELARAGRAVPELPAAIAADGVSFAYGPGAGSTLRGLSFEWPAGTALILEGANGAGKSTVLRLLLGLRPPTAGVVRLDRAVLADADTVAYRRNVAYLPQRPYLGDSHVRDAVRMLEPDASDEAIERVLERVGLASALRGRAEAPLEVPVGELSAGQRQRLALARVLLRDAPLVLLDEPDANLDRAGIRLVADIVEELVAAGKMVAIAAHTSELGAMTGTRVAL